MSIEYLRGSYPLTFEEPKSQVFKATHNYKEGAWKRSLLMNRSFISFTFDGKPIEDFGLIAITKEDRINKNAYSDVKNLTTDYEIMDGHYYWGTTMGARQIDLVLATDGITEEQLNNFKHWFRPGNCKELVLAEHPNRGIMARVAATPQLSVLPFEKQTSITFEGETYPTSVTLYKGEISLSFIADEPYWYARNNYIFPYYTNKEDKFGSMELIQTETNNNESQETYYNTWKDKDCRNVMLSDCIPYLDMIVYNKVILGNGEVVDLNRAIAAENDQDAYYNGVAVANIDNTSTELVEGRTAGISNVGNGFTLGNGDTQYLFYSGTAPSKPIITFTLHPIIWLTDNYLQEKHHYIAYPLNEYSRKDWAVGVELPSENKLYNTFSIGNSVMKFSLPSIYLSFNQAKDIVRTMIANGINTYNELYEALRDGVYDQYARRWALACLKNWDSEQYDFETFSTRMNWFIMRYNNAGTTTMYNSMEITCDSQKGTCIGEITIRQPLQNLSFSNDDQLIESGGNAATGTKFITVTQNVGDMLQSPYLIINERCSLNENGYVSADSGHSLAITTDYPNSDSLTNVTIYYKNMYL